MLPRNPEEWDEVAAGFAKVSQDELFGGCVSAVDGFFQSTGQVFEAFAFFFMGCFTSSFSTHNRKISMIFPLVSCCSCVNNPSSF